MMARLGYFFQIVSIMVVFLAALACASGDTEATQDAGGVTAVTGGTTAATGGTVAPSTGGVQAEPPGTGTGGVTATGGTDVATGGTDDVVPPECGNNIAEDGETCDGVDLAGTSCVTLGYASGDVSCTDDCQNFDTSLCVAEEETVVDAGADVGYGG